MLSGKRWTDLRDQLAQDLTNVNKIAAGMVRGELNEVFAINANYSEYLIENGMRMNYGFTLYDRNTVANLVMNDPDIIPWKPDVDVPADLRWNRQMVTSHITQGILQGESIPHLSRRLLKTVNNDRIAAVRTARTAVTSAQNAGRQAVYDKAKSMGLNLQKEWLATLDGRTRHDHGMADGQRVPLDGKFTVGGHKMKYPGDMSAPGWLVYNCRCTTITVEPERITKGEEPRKTYDEWIKDKKKEQGKKKKEGKKTQVQKGMVEKQVEAQQTTSFTPAKTTAEAEAYAKEHIFSGAYLGKTSYKGIDVDMANDINRTLERITKKYGRKLSGIEVVNPKTAKGLKSLGGSADAPFATNSLNGMVYINKDIIKNAKALKAYTDRGDEAFKLVMANKDKLSGKMRTLAEIYEKAGKDLVDSSLEGMITHEYGHYLTVSINPKADVVSKIADGMSDHLISGYSQHNVREYLAECFTEYERGDRSKLDPIVIELFEGAIKL